MEREPARPLHPDTLPPGTVVGPWRVVEWAGRGVHGAVYRALSVADSAAPPVALKLALVSGDPRFAREVALLSRLSHPSIPGMVDSGVWQPPGGPPYSYVAMEWVSGAPLYDWARQHPPSSPQLLRLVAQLARALEAVHAHGAVHRDVKGDNVMVRRSDSRAFLTDFGSGNLRDAAVLTPPFLQPGTPIYRSPESWLFALSLSRDALVPYAAKPADDLFALGVTACRLVTGQYPKLADPYRDDEGSWHLDAVTPPASLQQAEPLLRDSILRMLSVLPEQRGTAARLATALEHAAEQASAGTPPETRPKKPPATLHPAALLATLVTMTAGMALVLWAWWVDPNPFALKSSSTEPMAMKMDRPGAGTQGLGESMARASAEDTSAPSTHVMAEDALPEPLEGQVSPDARGRCPKQQVALNGGCWVEAPWDREKCEAVNGQMFKGTCYVPTVSPHRRRPNSNPTP